MNYKNKLYVSKNCYTYNMKMSGEKYNLAGNCVHGLDDPYFRRNVCSDATEMAGIVDEDSNEFLLGDDFIKNVNWSYNLLGLPSDNIYEFAYNPYKDIYWAYNIEDDVHFFFVKDSINENYRDTITVKTIKLSNILEGMLSEPEGKYLYIGTCVDSFDEYGECIHDAFYDEEHFFNSWENAVEISKEEFWSNIDPSSDEYDEVKELESDPEYPAEYRYSEDDDIYFIFVGDYLHYFFVSPDSYENIKDDEDEDSYDINLQENIARIRKIMGLDEIIDNLPQDSYIQMNVKNFKRYKKELTDILKPYLDQSGGDFVKFKSLVVKTMDKINPILHDYIPQDNTFLNMSVSGGGDDLNKRLFGIFNDYFNPKEKTVTEKHPCINSLTLDSIRLVGPVIAKNENDLANRWLRGVGGKLYRVVLPEDCYSQLNPEERASLYVTIEPNENRIHFPGGVPEKLRGSGLGKLIYLKTIQELGYITSSIASSPGVKMMYEDFLTNPEYKNLLLVLILQKNLLLIDKNTSLDIIKIFKEFVNGKYTDQKYVAASPDLKSILGKEYDDWYTQLGSRDIPSLIEKYKDREPVDGDTVVDVRDNMVYQMGGENTFNQGKPNQKTVIWLSGEKYKDKYIDPSEKTNFKVISPYGQ